LIGPHPEPAKQISHREYRHSLIEACASTWRTSAVLVGYFSSRRSLADRIVLNILAHLESVGERERMTIIKSQ
jgi:hypothetical protein